MKKVIKEVMLGVTLTILTAAVNGADKLEAIRRLMDAAASGKNMNVTYIVAGDSTRDSRSAGQEYIYTKMLKQINIRYVHDARSGIRGYQWVRNSIADASLKKAIANSAGQGENTIMEFSLGINDKNAYSRAQTKQNLEDCLRKYLKAKPKAHVFLVVPVTHYTSFQKEWPKLYAEIAEELNLPLINKERVMYDAFYDPQNRFYYDNTHPNYFGALRLIRYILETVSGADAKNKFKWTEDFFTGSKHSDPKINLAANAKIIKKSWYWPHNKSKGMIGGKAYNHPVLNRLEPVKVAGNSLIKISGIKPYFISMMNADGKLVYTFSDMLWKKHNVSYVYVPEGITEIRMTLHKPDGDKPQKPLMTYMTTGALSELTPEIVYYHKKK